MTSHLDTSPREMKRYIHTNAYAQLFIVVLFIITKELEITQMSFIG